MTRKGRRAPPRAGERVRARHIAAMAAACCALLFAAAGHAEKADREKPINLEADRVTVDDARQTSVFEGNVVLTQGTLVIRGDRMEVRQDATTDSGTARLGATSPTSARSAKATTSTSKAGRNASSTTAVPRRCRCSAAPP
jgi:lipopolysaccharide export system protein LptA